MATLKKAMIYMHKRQYYLKYTSWCKTARYCLALSSLGKGVSKNACVSREAYLR